ncbi:MAG: hypothetical protein ACLQGP_21305 [Isosphaeraceae bacterium]
MGLRIGPWVSHAWHSLGLRRQNRLDPSHPSVLVAKPGWLGSSPKGDAPSGLARADRSRTGARA